MSEQGEPVAKETENRPIVGQEHENTDEPDGWYRREGMSGLWAWNGKEWTGEWIEEMELDA